MHVYVYEVNICSKLAIISHQLQFGTKSTNLLRVAKILLTVSCPIDLEKHILSIQPTPPSAHLQ